MASNIVRKNFSDYLFGKGTKVGINVILCSEYALKSNLPIKWIRPEKIPCFKPEKSGDCKPLEKVDPTQFAPQFREIEELKNANEHVKKLFSLEYWPYKTTVNVLREEYLKKVRRHQYDDMSPEARVAKMTADIRDMQRYVDNYPRDKRAIVRLKETIDKRKKLLKLIRTWDYKCYEYLLEQLDLIFKANPMRDAYKRVERKRSLRLLTEKYCENIVQEKLSKYKAQLSSQQEDFLIEKIKTLKWMQEQEAYCGVSPTVSDADIKKAEDKLKELKEEKERNRVDVLEQ